MLENKMSENGKPDKMPDNLNRTLTGSGPFMSLHSHTYILSLSLYSLSLSLLINTFLSFCTHSISTSLSLSTHTPSLYLSTHLLFIATHSLSISISKHSFPLSAHTFHLSLSPSLSTRTLPPTGKTPYTHSLSLYTLPLFQNILLPSL